MNGTAPDGVDGMGAIDEVAPTDAGAQTPTNFKEPLEPERKKRAGFTRNKGLGTPKSKRRMAKVSRRRNRQ